MALVTQDKLNIVKELYYIKKYSMKKVGEELGVSLDCISYFMRKNNLKRRTLSEEQKLRFENSKPTFTIKGIDKTNAEIRAIGVMLYWGEGYKGDDKNPAKLVDFANSDPDMIRVFISFMRKSFYLDESKFRVLLYCYADQEVNSLIEFWSKTTGISRSQFTKPCIRKDFKEKSRKMKYGLIHIRYHDKKLLLEMKKMIDSYKIKYLS